MDHLLEDPSREPNRDLSRDLSREWMRRTRPVELPAAGEPLSAPEPPLWPAPPVPQRSGGLVDHWKLLVDRKWQLLAIAGVCALAGLLTALLQTPLYQAHTSLEIQGPNENFMSLKDLDPSSSSGPSFAETYVETQARILKDEGLIERVIDRLGVSRRPQSLLQPGPLARLLGRPLAPPQQDLTESLVLAAAQGLGVRASSLSHVVDVTFDSPDPQFAADFANAISNELIEQNLDVRWKASLKTADWLSRQMQDLKGRYEKSAHELQDYARATGLVFNFDKGATAAEDRLRLVQEELTRAQADLAAKQSRYELSKSSSPESVPEVLDNGPLREYQLKLTELRRALAELEAGFTPGYFKVKNMRAQVNELESVIRKERSNIVERLRNEYETAQRREKLLEQDFDTQSKIVAEEASSAVHYDVLKREVESNRLLYEATLQKVKEAGVAAAVRASNIRVISPAKRPLHPFQPKPVRNAAMGLLGGLFLGFVFIFLRQHTDRSFQAPGELATYLNISELGAIPAAGLLTTRVVARQEGAALLPPAGREAQKSLVRSALGIRPRVEESSQIAESFRFALASLWLGPNGKRPRLIVLTSPGAGEGKTTVASNLAIALANTNRRVLLVDGDLRKPSLHAAFQVKNTWGLSNLLEDRSPVKDYVFSDLASPTQVSGVYVLPAGTGSADIASLRYHERLMDLIARLRLEFHAVLLDTPPMLEFSDARILGRLSDGVILVVRSSETTREDAAAVQRRFQEDGTVILGSILNHWNPKKPQYGYGYRT